jgi:hypothetical protein
MQVQELILDEASGHTLPIEPPAKEPSCSLHLPATKSSRALGGAPSLRGSLAWGDSAAGGEAGAAPEAAAGAGAAARTRGVFDDDTDEEEGGHHAAGAAQLPGAPSPAQHGKWPA